MLWCGQRRGIHFQREDHRKIRLEFPANGETTYKLLGDGVFVVGGRILDEVTRFFQILLFEVSIVSPSDRRGAAV